MRIPATKGFSEREVSHLYAHLQKWLGSYIKVQSVVAIADESKLTVTVTYAPLRDGRTGGLFRTLTRENGDVWDQNGQVPPGGRPAGQRGVNPNPGQ